MSRLRTAILAPALLALLALMACSPSARDGEEAESPLQIGTVIEGLGDAEGKGAFVNIPTGRIDFIVGTPTDSLPTFFDTDFYAEDGGSIVAVSWNFVSGSEFSGMADKRTDAVEPQVRLVADGREYSLNETMFTTLGEDSAEPGERVRTSTGTAWVGVAGEPKELAIRVEFDGLDQEVEVGNPFVDHDNPASRLYESPDDLGLRVAECAAPRSGGRVLPDAVCQLEIAHVPYHPAVGWVTGWGDDSWVEVRSFLLPEKFRTAPSKCGPGELGEVTYQLGDAKPVAVERISPDLFPTGRDLVIFKGGPARGELVMRAEMSFPDGDCAPLPLTWRHRVF